MKTSSANEKETKDEAICCELLDPGIYRGTDGEDYKILEWDQKPFVKDGTWTVFYVPLGYGRAMARTCKKIDDAGASMSKKEMIVLSDCDSPWYSTMLISTTKDEVAGAEMVKISGKFVVKVFEGEYKMIGDWIQEIKALVTELKENKVVECEDVEKMKMYFHYTTCPKCSKKYGKNYVVIFAKI